MFRIFFNLAHKFQYLSRLQTLPIINMELVNKMIFSYIDKIDRLI